MSQDSALSSIDQLIKTDVAFKLDQGVIVDAHITSLVTPLRLKINQLTAEQSEASNNWAKLVEQLAVEANKQKLDSENDAKVQALVAAFQPFIDSGEKVYVHSRAYLHDKYIDKTDSYIKVAMLELNIIAITQDFDPEKENYDDHEYTHLYGTSLQLPGGESMKEISAKIDETNVVVKRCGLEIQKAEANIRTIQGKRAEYLSALNTQLLAQSTAGQQILGVLQNVHVPLLA